MDVKSLTDAELIRRSSQGFLQCYEVLVQRYESKIYSFANSLTDDEQLTEVILSEVFIRFFSEKDSAVFEPSAEKFLYRLAVKVAVELVAEQVKSTASSVREIGLSGKVRHLEAQKPMREIEQDTESLACALRAAATSMPKEYQLLLLLRDTKGLGYEDISYILEISEQQVRTRLLRARLLMRKKLEPYFTNRHKQIYPKTVHSTQSTFTQTTVM